MMVLCTIFFRAAWRRKQNDQQNAGFSLLSWSDGAPANQSCVAEFLAWTWLWEGRCGCVSKEEVTTVAMTCIAWLYLEMNRFFTGITLGVPKSLCPCRTFSMRTLSFGIRVARISCFLGERAKDTWILSGLKRNLFPVISLHTDCVCTTQARMQQCSLVCKASPTQSDQQFEFVLHVWVSRCSHMAAGSFVVVVIPEDRKSVV